MTKNTPNKRKSLVTATASPNKIQKTVASPNPKNAKSPKNANKTTPQKKQLNGKQGKKKPVKTEEEEENESEESMEQELNGNSDSEVEQDDSDDAASDEEQGDSEDDDEDESDEEEEAKPVKKDLSNERRYSVFVGGLDFEATEGDLLQHFNKDSILKATVLRKPGTNKSKGSAFINFKDENSMKKALQKDGTEFKGRTLKVSLPTTASSAAQLEKKKALLAKLKGQVSLLEKQIGKLSKADKIPKSPKKEKKQKQKKQKA